MRLASRTGRIVATVRKIAGEIRLCQVQDAEVHDHRIKAAVAKRQRFGIGFLDVQLRMPYDLFAVDELQGTPRTAET